MERIDPQLLCFLQYVGEAVGVEGGQENVCWSGSTSCALLGKLGKLGKMEKVDGMQAKAVVSGWGECFKICLSPLSGALPQAMFQRFISTTAAQD